MSPVFGEGTELKAAEIEGAMAPDRPTVVQPSVRPGVFLVINSLETGGSERQFAALVRSLDTASFRVQLGCLQKRGTFLDSAGMEHFRVGGSLYRWQSIQSRYRMARYMRRADIAIAHAFDFYTNLMLIPAARMARIPVVIGSQRQLGDLLTPLQYRIQAAMFRLSDCIICNSQAAADRLIHAGVPGRRIRVIANGLPAEAFEKTEPALPRRTGVTRIGMIARMNLRAKNHHAFLAAAARVLAKFPNAEFVLAGDGPLRPELEAAAQQLGLGDRIHFLGDRRDIPAVLASFDVSVLPSASESLSNVIIESMAAGVPVVATCVGGNPELVTERTGILVPPDDVDALAAGIERLLDDYNLRAQLGRNARQFATSHFTSEQMRVRHEELYRELLERKRWKPRPGAKFVADRSATIQRTRVAIVAASLRYVGGQSVQADLLVENCRHDEDVSATLVPIDPPLPRVIAWVERIPLLRTIVREPFYLWSLWRELKHTDIAHIFSASYWSFFVAPVPALIMARLRGKKALIHYHSGEARDHLKRFHTARPLLAKADLLVVPSGYLVDVFREFGLNATAVPNIVDLSQFTFRLRGRLRPHLVCTRGFHPYYCADVVVRAFAEVQKAYPEARLDLVGNGPLERELRELVQELHLSNVEFTGVASRGEIGRFYDRADIFINASRLDNMPVSVLEAFASGTPVVSTAPEGMRYLVDHERTGLLSEPGDAQSLAKNVIRVLENPELTASLAHNAHEESRRYRWEAVREQWLDIYRSLMPRVSKFGRIT